MPVRTGLISLGFAVLAFFGTGIQLAHANSCFEDLLDERPGMIQMDETARLRPLGSREAQQMLSETGQLILRRDVEDFWRIKVGIDVEPSDLRVEYRLSGGSDRVGPAVHRTEDSQRFPVRILPQNPYILCENTEHRIIAGGFVLTAHISGVGLAGIYGLEIDVDVRER